AVSSAPRLAPSSRNWTPTTATLSDAVAETVTLVPATVVPFTGAVTDTVGGVESTLLTVTETGADVVLFPAASRATAVSACGRCAVGVVSTEGLQGGGVPAGPRFAPSSLNCPPAPPLLSGGFADPGTVADTVDPAAGAVTATVGGVVSLSTVTVTAVAVAVLPAASLATAVNVCDPFATVFESHLMLYGPAVSAAPRFAPSSLKIGRAHG